MAALARPAGGSGTVRVLALPGWRTNRDILSFQLGGLKRALRETQMPPASDEDAQDWEVTCLNPVRPASGPPYEAISRLFGDGPYFEWWNSVDGSTPPRYEGMDEAVKHVLSFVREHGPFEVLAGFSQGGALVSLLDMQRHELPVHLRWTCSLLLGAPPARDGRVVDKYREPVPGPSWASLVMIGEQDQLKPMCETLAGHYAAWHGANSEVVAYPEPHQPPTWRRSSEQLLYAARRLRAVAQGPVWWAFDFDGVLCHSARETCLSGLRAGRRVLPELFTPETLEEPLRDTLLTAFYELRPLLEHGYDSIVLSYMVLRSLEEDSDIASVSRKIGQRLRESGFAGVLEELQEQGVSVDDLKTALHEAREEWRAADLDGWVRANEFYPKAVQAVKELCDNGEAVYIITTKHKDFALPLIKHIGLNVPTYRVFGQGMGAKEDVIERLGREEEAGKTCFFLEDRVNTLVRVSEEVSVPCRMAFATWGYNQEVDEALSREKRFATLSEAELARLVDGHLSRRQQ